MREHFLDDLCKIKSTGILDKKLDDCKAAKRHVKRINIYSNSFENENIQMK